MGCVGDCTFLLPMLFVIYLQEDGGKGNVVSTYLVEPINHHSSGYPYPDVKSVGVVGGMRSSTLPRQPKQHHLLHGSPLDLHSGHPMHQHHEDDGYVDALRRSGFNPGEWSESTTYIYLSETQTNPSPFLLTSMASVSSTRLKLKWLLNSVLTSNVPLRSRLRPK